MTMFDDARYRWNDEPDDGEYEFQFDRFETTEHRYDQTVLLIVDKDAEATVGHAILPTTEVPGIDREDPNTTRIYHGRMEDGEIVDLNYDPELSQRRHEKAQEQYDQIFGNNDESGVDD